MLAAPVRVAPTQLVSNGLYDVRPRNKFLRGVSDKILFRVVTTKVKSKKSVLSDASINEHLLKLAERTKPKFLADVNSNLRSLRNFLIRDIAPKVLPTMSAIDDAKTVLGEIVGAPVSSQLYGTLVRQLEAATEVKAASWVTKHLGLDEQERELFLRKAGLLPNGNQPQEVSSVQALHDLLRSIKEDTQLQLRQVQAGKKSSAVPQPYGSPPRLGGGR